MSNSTERVAFYGAGMLGSAMVQSLLRRGIAVNVWNRTPAKAQALEAFGAQVFTDPAQAAQGVDRVHLCLKDDAAVDAVIEAALPGIGEHVSIVDHTTVLPQKVIEREARLRGGGYGFVHAPVFIGPAMALESKGVMMTSGAAALYERLRTPLSGMCSDLRYLGPRADAAAIYKLMGNAMILAVVGGINDVLRIAEMSELTREQAYALFDFYDPCGQVRGRGKRMAENDFTPTWTLDMAHKDAVLMQEAAHHERLPVIDAMEQLMRAVADRGLGAEDLAAVAHRP